MKGEKIPADTHIDGEKTHTISTHSLLMRKFSYYMSGENVIAKNHQREEVE